MIKQTRRHVNCRGCEASWHGPDGAVVSVVRSHGLPSVPPSAIKQSGRRFGPAPQFHPSHGQVFTAPMEEADRLDAYVAQNGGGRRLTPRQWRRIRHKRNHAQAQLSRAIQGG